MLDYGTVSGTQKYSEIKEVKDQLVYETLQACASISVLKLCNFPLPYLVNFVKKKLIFCLFPYIPRITSFYKIF